MRTARTASPSAGPTELLHLGADGGEGLAHLGRRRETILPVGGARSRKERCQPIRQVRSELLGVPNGISDHWLAAVIRVLAVAEHLVEGDATAWLSGGASTCAWTCRWALTVSAVVAS